MQFLQRILKNNRKKGLIVNALEKMVTGSVKVSKKEIEDTFALEGRNRKNRICSLFS